MKNLPIDRAEAYFNKVPGAISGQGGHAATFRAASLLVHGFGLSEAESFPLFTKWNQRCQPQWTEAELRHKLADADRANHSKPRGHLLGEGGGIPSFRQSSPSSAADPAARPLPDRSGFGPGTAEQIKHLAEARPYNRIGLEWACERGLLVFGQWHGSECYGVTDQSGRVLELRRTDGKPFPAVLGTSLNERKSHAVKGSQKSWPLGVLEAREFPCIALVEGMPDFLTAHHVALFEQESDRAKRDPRCAPVVMLSASPQIHPDALPYFSGKKVRLFPHVDGAGLRGAIKWQAQLLAAGAVHVDVFDFGPYPLMGGGNVSDLWEFTHQMIGEIFFPSDTWRIMP